MVVLSKKLIQLKDREGNLIYPVYIPQKIPNKIDVLLNTPLQSNGTTKVTKVLNSNPNNYDILLVRVNANHSGTEAITIPFYNIGQYYGQVVYVSSFYPSGYNADVYIGFEGNTIAMQVTRINGWLSNQIWIENIIGIKLV